MRSNNKLTTAKDKDDDNDDVVIGSFCFLNYHRLIHYDIRKCNNNKNNADNNNNDDNSNNDDNNNNDDDNIFSKTINKEMRPRKWKKIESVPEKKGKAEKWRTKLRPCSGQRSVADTINRCT